MLIPFLWVFYFCVDHPEEVKKRDGEALFKQYCGNCHQLPNPEHLTKEVWEKSVLPKMGFRLGLIEASDHPYQGLSAEEVEIYKENEVYPDRQLITDADWARLKAYILERAPETIPFDESRIGRNESCRQFVRKDLHVDQLYGGDITAIEFDSQKKELWLGDFNNQVWHWKKGGRQKYESTSPVVDFHFSEKGTLWTEIGKLFPTELKTGKLTLMNEGNQQTVLDAIHRPVFSHFEDLNGDGQQEIIVCQYGHRTGSLSLYRLEDGQYVEQVLIPVPGAIKVEVRDLNGDGKKDITALFAQGDEALYMLYQKKDLKFKTKKAVRFPAEYGTSDFILFDYDKDGDLDLATVHGDNADLSYILKPYHGLRLHINTQDQYQEAFFYPLYGATRLQIDDFDEDGDWDFAIAAFFPDFERLLNESFVYLENIESSTYQFRPTTIDHPTPLRSLTLEKADFDGDGDTDLILGLFTHSPQPLPAALDQTWKKAKFDISVLFNQQR